MVFVHGRAQAFKDRPTLENTWTGAFETGLEKIGLIGVIGPSDRSMVYYAGVFAPGYTPSPNCIRVTSRAGGATGQSVALDRLWEDEEPVRGRFIDQLKTVLTRRLVNLPFGTAIALSFLDDTRAYIEHRARYCDTNEKVAETLRSAKAGGRPVVVVAHSMGSLVVYNLLQGLDRAGEDPLPVSRFVSFGSQLGVSDLIPYLTAGRTAPPYVAPKSVASWVNIVGRDDYIAWPASETFRASPVGVIDIEPRTEPGNPHGVTGYLLHPWTARAIAAAWCGAFRPPATRPTECASVQDVAAGMRDP